ncbi:MAG: methionine aminotransferase [Bacteroidales bacterium]|nr:methionine aminotransferase [Bacteroidales bacterium]
MKKFNGNIISKLPGVETSIFAVMSGLANQHNAINLSQGFPDFQVSEKLIASINQKMKNGLNQYAPMPGVLTLREQIAAKASITYGIDYNVDREVTITAGATQALFTAITAFIREDDEVIIFEPAYDSYGPAVRLNSGVVKYVQLKLPDYHIDWQEVANKITHRTKMIIINSPHNPSGSVLSEQDLLDLQRITVNTDIVILSDEVYEHIIFDGKKHESVCSYPELAERSIVVGSFGKTFHATGWKIGFSLAPENLMKEFRKSHQFNVYAVNTPIQHAFAEYMRDPENYLHLGEFYQQKRDFFIERLKNSRFKIIPSYGTYFQSLDYSNISEENEMDFATRLITEFGVAGIPVSAFYHKKDDNKILRFCFAKGEETLEKAAEILCKI